ncbi:hypothetical protein TI39_contig5819g00012 [Zymoseptoria brevis]|uniref:Wax synthase domain-containing protein n=1 Tax=Zymoseptoria brevis TaxID=1047168 RepID=A0A0F4G691_9PEZI|nr:hypothetical protein TI39_contig5819g00012 [Zymoseptoria brevis]
MSMSSLPLPSSFRHALESAFTGELRPGLRPIEGTKPLTLEALFCPVLLYYIALLLLPPPPPQTVASVHISTLRNVLAATAAYLFLRLPLAYHVPQSIGLTYQLGLVGIYGGLRVLDAFFVSLYGFGHIPRRVRYSHHLRPETPRGESAPRPWADGGSNGMLKDPTKPPAGSQSKGDAHSTALEKQNDILLKPTRPKPQRMVSQSDLLENMTSQSYTDLLNKDDGYMTMMTKLVNGPKPIPVIETAHTEDGWPHGFADRASWALELELSMRGVGFTWTTADIRHTTKTWLPTVQNRLHSIVVHVGPVLVLAWAVIRYLYVRRLAPMTAGSSFSESPFDELSLPEQYLLTTALGAFLMAAFSLGHSMFAIICSPLAPNPISFFPPLYTTRVWDITSARGFWSYGWHRLFARLFLVWGVWPGEWVERKLTGKSPDQPADVGKVLGGFLSSAVVHSFSVRGTLAGSWTDAAGEAKFFALNGIAILVEDLVIRAVRSSRKSRQQKESRNFARGWTKGGLVREMAFM